MKSAITRVVVDTNVVLDLWAFGDPGVAALRQAVQAGHLDWVACPAMRRELQAVLARGVGAAYGARPETVLAEWDAAVRRVPDLDGPTGERPSSGWALPIKATPGLACRDEDDQVYIELALREGARVLLTSDRDLLNLRRRALRHGLLIERPRHWSLFA